MKASWPSSVPQLFWTCLFVSFALNSVSSQEALVHVSFLPRFLWGTK